MGLDLTILVVTVRSGISMKVWVKIGSRITVGLVEVRVGVKKKISFLDLGLCKMIKNKKQIQTYTTDSLQRTNGHILDWT